MNLPQTLALLIPTVIAACSAPDPGVDESDGAPATYEPTFSAVYREIIAARGCLLGLCHGEGGNAAGLNLQPAEAAYQSLVGAPSVSSVCSHLGLREVSPGEPDRSLFYLKLLAQPPCGVSMPPDRLLESARLEQVRQWIELGALNDGQ